MALSVFDDKSNPPGEKDLAKALGDAYKLWNSIKTFVLKECPDAFEEWNYSGKSYGWGFRLKDKKRIIVYLTPCEKYFKISLIFSEKATAEAMQSKISQEVKDIISLAKVYAEGRGFRIDVMNDANINDIKKLVRIKKSN
ncbi:MAG: DUF3788 domain-containing protein [FCB group bacterium]|jgi:hypothetical protein